MGYRQTFDLETACTLYSHKQREESCRSNRIQSWFVFPGRADDKTPMSCGFIDLAHQYLQQERHDRSLAVSGSGVPKP